MPPIEDYLTKSKTKSEPICADSGVFEKKKRKRRGREIWGRKWVGERDQLCSEENEKRGFASGKEKKKIK